VFKKLKLKFGDIKNIISINIQVFPSDFDLDMLQHIDQNKIYFFINIHLRE